ncbi:BLUF domain-containing protein [Litorivivens sp.]|uniref:BLUF domain-containing protein n=2 Tax=Litorivivens sp. TaxID=2020868 RepID=UPI0035614F65
MTVDQHSIRRVVYCSRATQAMDHDTLMKILHDARSFNAMDDISGILLHDRGYFLQVLEGPAEAIENLLATLRADTRHEQVQVLVDSEVDEKLFPNWQMGFGDLADPVWSFVPGMIDDDEKQGRLELLAQTIPDLAEHLNNVMGKTQGE